LILPIVALAGAAGIALWGVRSFFLQKQDGTKSNVYDKETAEKAAAYDRLMKEGYDERQEQLRKLEERSRQDKPEPPSVNPAA
jgi:hypothetical protein